jgi:hypothetical protein
MRGHTIGTVKLRLEGGNTGQGREREREQGRKGGREGEGEREGRRRRECMCMRERQIITIHTSVLPS